MVGVKGQTAASLIAAGQPVPRPLLIRALIDTGTDITAIAASVLTQLGLSPVQQHTTQTVSGPVSVQLFEVSLSLPPASPLLVLDRLLVMQLPTPLTGIDSLLGLDVVDRLLLILDGPRREMTVAD
jgi:hypothetical protein